MSIVYMLSRIIISSNLIIWLDDFHKVIIFDKISFAGKNNLTSLFYFILYKGNGIWRLSSNLDWFFGAWWRDTVYHKKYAHGFVVFCFVVVMQSFIMNSHEVFIHIHQGCFAGTGAIVRLPQCQWSKPDGYGKISQCITTTKHSKARTVCIFLGIYCIWMSIDVLVPQPMNEIWPAIYVARF